MSSDLRQALRDISSIARDEKHKASLMLSDAGVGRGSDYGKALDARDRLSSWSSVLKTSCDALNASEADDLAAARSRIAELERQIAASAELRPMKDAPRDGSVFYAESRLGNRLLVYFTTLESESLRNNHNDEEVPLEMIAGWRPLASLPGAVSEETALRAAVIAAAAGYFETEFNYSVHECVDAASNSDASPIESDEYQVIAKLSLARAREEKP